MIRYVLLIILCALNACSLIDVGGQRASLSSTYLREETNELKLEESVDDLARSSVKTTGTAFVVPFKDDHYAWERAQFYFQKFIDPKPPVIKIVKDRFILSNRENPNGNYTYEVFKDNISSGFRYSVICEPRAKGTREAADLNARNLSRFITDAKLEVSLITK